LASLFQALLVIWSTRSPAPVVRRIALLLPFWLIYGLMLVNTALCFWRRLPRLRQELGRAPILQATTPVVDEPLEASSEAEASAHLLRRGFRGSRFEGGRVLGVRRRWTALGSFAFHGAFFLIAMGFLLSLGARQEARVRVAEGEANDGASSRFVAMSPPRPLAAGVPAIPFLVERIRPEFFEDSLLFTRLEAEIAMVDGRSATTRINDPVWTSPFTSIRLSGFGHAPRYELRDRQGRLLDAAVTKLDVFPPGNRDWFEVPGYPHRFHLELLPEADWVEGRLVTRSMNLADPAFLLTVFRGRVHLGGATLRLGEVHEVEGLFLSFPQVRHWADFLVVFDPGIPAIFAGYALALFGLLAKLAGSREEAEWRPGPEGGGRLRVWSIARNASRREAEGRGAP
jgi:hypothetical protein